MKFLHRFAFIVLIFSAIFALTASTAFASGSFVWTNQTTGTGASGLGWYSITSSADGTKLAAADQSGDIFTSSDYGATWVTRFASSSLDFTGITSSSDGTKLAAVDFHGNILTSSDSGITWVTRFASSTMLWLDITSSTDGTKLAAADNDEGTILTSTDAGATWTQRLASSTLSFYAITSSSDGTKLAAADSNGNILTSADSGITWVTSFASSTLNFVGITSSSDGTKLAAVMDGGDAWTSTDSGVTWIDQTGSSVAANEGLYSVTSSSDGTRLAIVGSDNFPPAYIYTSSDGGVTWTQQTSAGSQNWTSITSSSDGTKLAAVVYGGDIWTGILSFTSPTAPTPAPSGGGGMIVGSGPLAPSAQGLSGYTPPRPQIDYPNGTIVYLDATTTTSTSTASTTIVSSIPITTPQTTLSASSSPFVIDRQLWDQGPDILALQQFLNTHGYVLTLTGPGSPGSETDFIGVKTYQALIKFQKAHGLPATGYLGPLTRAAINSL